MNILEELSQSLQRGVDKDVVAHTQKAIDSGLAVKQILDDGLIAGMSIVGERFKKHELFLPHVLLAAKAMYAGLDLLKPLMLKEGIPTLGKVVIGTVHGDLHDIGKNLVGIMLKGAGFEIIDLGKDVPAENFVEAAIAENAQVIGLSALLTTTMPTMKQVVDLATEQNVRDKFKIVIGGAPLSDEYAQEIGADAYCFDAVSAVDRVKQFVEN
ncbi:MAG: corrinoid protein [candidate division Zixibacteria bacterium]|nr:corrinoid protein [candidate division Zixibacteria bacterium]MDH3936415.1 corrinoid protein [candidate division Zixibacteria bacterium]MDH4034479.1 corrinoid protein [candidate division Zixibacteria bacterium]